MSPGWLIKCLFYYQHQYEKHRSVVADVIPFWLSLGMYVCGVRTHKTIRRINFDIHKFANKIGWKRQEKVIIKHNFNACWRNVYEPITLAICDSTVIFIVERIRTIEIKWQHKILSFGQLNDMIQLPIIKLTMISADFISSHWVVVRMRRRNAIQQTIFINRGVYDTRTNNLLWLLLLSLLLLLLVWRSHTFPRATRSNIGWAQFYTRSINPRRWIRTDYMRCNNSRRGLAWW